MNLLKKIAAVAAVSAVATAIAKTYHDHLPAGRAKRASAQKHPVAKAVANEAAHVAAHVIEHHAHDKK